METLESSYVCRLCGQQSGISINIFDKNENHIRKINTMLPIMVCYVLSFSLCFSFSLCRSFARTLFLSRPLPLFVLFVFLILVQAPVTSPSSSVSLFSLFLSPAPFEILPSTRGYVLLRSSERAYVYVSIYSLSLHNSFPSLKFTLPPVTNHLTEA